MTRPRRSCTMMSPGLSLSTTLYFLKAMLPRFTRASRKLSRSALSVDPHRAAALADVADVVGPADSDVCMLWLERCSAPSPARWSPAARCPCRACTPPWPHRVGDRGLHGDCVVTTRPRLSEIDWVGKVDADRGTGFRADVAEHVCRAATDERGTLGVTLTAFLGFNATSLFSMKSTRTCCVIGREGQRHRVVHPARGDAAKSTATGPCRVRHVRKRGPVRLMPFLGSPRGGIEDESCPER